MLKRHLAVLYLQKLGRLRLSGAATEDQRRLHMAISVYQTRQELAGYIGVPLVQPNALPNSSKF